MRGGGPDQNLVLLDDGVVYNAAHLFGFFSVFNSDAVKSVNLIKGGTPANYGGRLKNNMHPFLKLSCQTLFFLFFTFFVTCGYAQEKHTISGYITALASGEALSNAKVYVPSVNKGALTNTYGFYSLTLPAGIYEIEFRYTSFPTVRKTIDLSGKDVAINVELGFKDGEKVFEEVVVNGKKGENVGEVFFDNLG